MPQIKKLYKTVLTKNFTSESKYNFKTYSTTKNQTRKRCPQVPKNQKHI